MCGILGFTILKTSNYYNKIPILAKELFKLSETRGKEASGYSINNGEKIKYLRTPFTATELVNSKVFNNELTDLNKGNLNFISLIGHSRLVTNGHQTENLNNQPVLTKGIVGVHNGIVTNEEELLNKNLDIKKESQLDSELLFKLINKNYFHSKNKNIFFFYG